MSNSGRPASVRCAALRDCPADAGGCLRGELGDEVRRRRSAISRSGSYICAPKRLLCASPPHSGSPPRRRGPTRSVWTFRAEPALADAIAYTLYERQPIAGAHRGAPPRRSPCERTHSARLSAVRVPWKLTECIKVTSRSTGRARAPFLESVSDRVNDENRS